MMELESALEQIRLVIPEPASETIPLSAAENRILAAPVAAPVDLPLFDNSAMDGYAVRATDLAGASPESMVWLRLAGRIAAGARASGNVGPGDCIRLFTGSPLPEGADAVVMQEDTKMAPARPESIGFFESAKPLENVRLKGEDIRRGRIVAERGERVRANLIALLAAMGCREVRVARRPRIGLIATGDELREAGEPLDGGEIYESNRAVLAVLTSNAGGLPMAFPIVRDTLEATQTAIRTALESCDAVITSGGVSVGEYDFVKEAWEKAGGEVNFWKVAIKPGKPFVFGRAGGKFLFGLPGNPVSAFVTFLLLVRPALLGWQGARETEMPGHPARLAEPLINRGDRRHFMRVAVDAEGNTRSAGAQASHRLGSLADANGLVDVPPNTTLPAGQLVRALRWE